MKIVVMRHGKPQIDLNSLTQKFSPNALGEVIKQYEFTDIDSIQIAPKESLNIAQQCNAVLSSDLLRGISSVDLLNISCDHSIDLCFRESDLPYANWNKPFLSFSTWAILFRIAWFLGFSNNAESFKDAKKRAKICADKVIHSVQKNNTVLLLGHGIINRLIAKELRNSGWQKTADTGNQYWSYHVYEKHN